AECNPGLDRAPEFEDAVGIGAYRIDLHASTNGRPTIDLGSLPFQIPLGALVPVRTQNLIPACKNIGTTHVTNGCYRLHPVEWNIGEAAATLAATCIKNGKTPQQIHGSRALVQDVQSSLVSQGAELSWPDTPLRAL
ncbi:MAG: FAD-dependent oxidoreductase, partial [Armatimonadetes bacterium]|nr:FAD-dependent oxidoreductase [Armatimonadota bacterium]